MEAPHHVCITPHHPTPISAHPTQPSNADWESHFAELVRFHDQHGHVRVPVSFPLSPGLPMWLAAQRANLAHLTQTQARCLWELGVRFSGWESRWLFQFFKLADGKERFGNVNDPRICEHDSSLKVWIKTQRTMRGQRLAAYRWRWLNDLGFAWNLDDAMWEKRFAEWSDYVREAGGNSIPNESGYQVLAQWARFQRLQRRRGKLDLVKIHRLDEVGFAWNPQAEKWESHFRELESFCQIHGHARVGEVEGRSDLAAWCWDQTRHYKRGEVSDERIVRLNALGFVWNPREDFFDRMLPKLKRFHALHGHGRVPENWPEEPRLAAWIGRLRQARKKGLLPDGRIHQLDGLFEWSPRGQ
jgi:hypothetical protein